MPSSNFTIAGNIIARNAMFRGYAVVDNGAIVRVVKTDDIPRGAIDVWPAMIWPGLVDIHVHGCDGLSFNEADIATWTSILISHQQHGTTTLSPTIATANARTTLELLGIARRICAGQTKLHAPLIHLEGPYLNPAQRGVHNASLLRLPSDEWWYALEPWLDIIGVVTLAPELPGALDMIRFLSNAGVIVSVGHSACSPVMMTEAVTSGLSHIAHLWSGQSTLSKSGPFRNPGLLEAALSSSSCTAEIIADGFHTTKELITIAYRCFGDERLCLISDASPGTGLPVGTSFHLGAAVGRVSAGVALAEDGLSFCGSTSYLFTTVRYCIRELQLPLISCVKMASATPARRLGIDNRVGQITGGYLANLLIVNDDLELIQVIHMGKWL